MEFIVENLWYIDNMLGKSVCQDARHNVYIIPKYPVLYEKIYADMNSFNKFYVYVSKQREDTIEQGMCTALTYIYTKIRLLNTPIREFLRGYKELQRLAKQGKSSQILARMEKASVGSIREYTVERLFLEANEYLSNLKQEKFYKAECVLARSFIARSQLAMAYRYAREALEIASKNAFCAGIEESRALLEEIEKSMQGKKQHTKSAADEKKRRNLEPENQK